MDAAATIYGLSSLFVARVLGYVRRYLTSLLLSKTGAPISCQILQNAACFHCSPDLAARTTSTTLIMTPSHSTTMSDLGRSSSCNTCLTDRYEEGLDDAYDICIADELQQEERWREPKMESLPYVEDLANSTDEEASPKMRKLANFSDILAGRGSETTFEGDREEEAVLTTPRVAAVAWSQGTFSNCFDYHI